ncbi:hypothetical protein [Sulfurimonas sp.]|uniref:hypothetical protein n=1 Tax=Sulfurimonas sp. TaxID=2022749 RepID=UPI0019F44D0C|nr:hypothetical protein [Sulfurimonas sp.]MBE0514512.1 hypothetical protein [Sulfurimonas sp.]
MNFKKIWLFLLLATISFSVVHDYTFAHLEDDHYYVSSYLHEAPDNALAKTSDTLCEVHIEYHSVSLFVERTADIPVAQKKDNLFKYNKMFLSLDYFNFFKPPIA